MWMTSSITYIAIQEKTGYTTRDSTYAPDELAVAYPWELGIAYRLHKVLEMLRSPEILS